MSTATEETLYSETRSGESCEYRQDDGPVGNAFDQMFIDDDAFELVDGEESEDEAQFTEDESFEGSLGETSEDRDSVGPLPALSQGSRGSKSFTSQAENDLICPITLRLMRDPVCAADGFSYERSALEKHLKTKKTSPKTNKRMAAQFYDNRTLKAVIETFKGEPDPEPDPEPHPEPDPKPIGCVSETQRKLPPAELDLKRGPSTVSVCASPPPSSAEPDEATLSQP